MSLSRRDFIKAAGGSIGGVFWDKVTRALALPDKVYSREIVTVGNLKVTPVLFEHGKKDWDVVKKDVLSEINGYSIIIPEYFPFEYRNLIESNPLLHAGNNLLGYDEGNVAFVEIESWAHRSGKQVVVVDPAYSTDAVWFRAKENAPYAVAGTAASGVATAIVSKVLECDAARKAEKYGPNPVDALPSVGSLVIGSVLTAGIGVDMMSRWKINEVDFRQLSIANALITLGENVLPGTSVAILYPPEHWNGSDPEKIIVNRGILYYLNNRDEARRMLESYRHQYPKEKYPDFYNIRHYQPDGDGWKKATEIATDRIY